MEKYSWKDFGKIANIDDLSGYLAGKEYLHGSYCHYTSLVAIEKILESRSFYLSNVSGFNDKIDTKQFSPQQNFFSLCFSTGINENLSLWYMYAGLDGHGGRLNFTKAQIKKLLSNASYELCEIDNNKNIVEIIATLINGKSMKISFRDILYYIDRGCSIDLKYNTMTNHIIPKSGFDEFLEQYKGFTKSLIWYYEKETRLLVELIGESINYIKPGKKYIVKMSIDDHVFQKMKIDLAPEITDANFDFILSDKNNIKQFIKTSSKVNLSAYSGTIEMKLCEKCSLKY